MNPAHDPNKDNFSGERIRRQFSVLVLQSKEQAETVGSSIIEKDRSLGFAVEKQGDGFIIRLHAFSEVVPGKGLIPLTGTVVHDGSGTPAGVQFIGYTPECSSENECWWVEDFKGKKLQSLLIPR